MCMKLLIELLGGLVIGALSAVVLLLLDVDVTPAQTGIIIGSIVVITTIVNGITTAINKKNDDKKEEE